MKKIIPFLILFVLLSCAEKETLEVVEARKKAKTEVDRILERMSDALGDVDLTRQYRREMLELDEYGINEALVIAVSPDISSGLAEIIISVIIERDERGAVPYLIKMLESSKEGTRNAANEGLQRLTGKNFGFVPAMGISPENEKSIAEWKNWWTENKGEYAGKSTKIPYPAEWD